MFQFLFAQKLGKAHCTFTNESDINALARNKNENPVSKIFGGLFSDLPKNIWGGGLCR